MRAASSTSAPTEPVLDRAVSRWGRTRVLFGRARSHVVQFDLRRRDVRQVELRHLQQLLRASADMHGRRVHLPGFGASDLLHERVHRHVDRQLELRRMRSRMSRQSGLRSADRVSVRADTRRAVACVEISRSNRTTAAAAAGHAPSATFARMAFASLQPGRGKCSDPMRNTPATVRASKASRR